MPVREREVVNRQEGGWGGYIERNPRLAAENETLKLTRKLWAEIERVNARVNRRRWTPEQGDHWDHSLPDDCENFALNKRRALGRKGIPLGALRVVTGRVKLKGKWIDHAMLCLVTDRGDYLLDNLTDDIEPWEEREFRPLLRTAGGNRQQIVGRR